jgi:hypothetical protein
MSGRSFADRKAHRAAPDLTRGPRGGSYRANAGGPEASPIADKRTSRRPMSNPATLLAVGLAVRGSLTFKRQALALDWGRARRQTAHPG